MSMSFAEQMRMMEEAMKVQQHKEEGVFGTDENNPNMVRLINPEQLFNKPITRIQERMIRNVQKMDKYSWSRGTLGGLRSKFPQFDSVLEGGVQPGLILLAAPPNVGKSAVMLQLMKDISESNDNVYCSYHSLDDSNNELMPRYIACDQMVPIAQGKNPERFMDDPEIIAARNRGIENLYRRSDKFGMFDGNDDMTSLEKIEQHIKDLLMECPEGTKIVIGIDSFNDLTIDSQKFNNNDMRNEYVAKAIKDWTTTYNITVMCTAHMRKTNGRRPTVDDLKDTVTLQYEANLILLMYNEVGVKEENSGVYWISEDDEKKMPVIEMKFGKNKFSSYKGTIFYEFMPDYSYSVEAPIESGRRYASLIYQA